MRDGRSSRLEADGLIAQHPDLQGEGLEQGQHEIGMSGQNLRQDALPGKGVNRAVHGRHHGASGRKFVEKRCFAEQGVGADGPDDLFPTVHGRAGQPDLSPLQII